VVSRADGLTRWPEWEITVTEDRGPLTGGSAAGDLVDHRTIAGGTSCRRLTQVKPARESALAAGTGVARLRCVGLHRQTRRRLSTWMIGVLLLAQWLVAAYACPVATQTRNPGGDPASAHAVMADCHGMTPSAMDADNPSLCKAHCSADQQAPAQAAPDEVPVPSLGWFIAGVAGPLDVAAARAGPPAVPRSGAPPGWPPIYLIHQVLRN
jgi:hypothetical protein